MEKSFVTMEQKMCPVCGKEHDSGALLLDRSMRNKFDMKTTTGYDLCKNCNDKKSKGFVALIVCDTTKSKPDGTTMKMENAHRTGEIIHLKKEIAKDMFNIDIKKHDFCFIEPEVRDHLKKLKEGAK